MISKRKSMKKFRVFVLFNLVTGLFMKKDGENKWWWTTPVTAHGAKDIGVSLDIQTGEIGARAVTLKQWFKGVPRKTYRGEKRIDDYKVSGGYIGVYLWEKIIHPCLLRITVACFLHFEDQYPYQNNPCSDNAALYFDRWIGVRYKKTTRGVVLFVCWRVFYLTIFCYSPH